MPIVTIQRRMMQLGRVRLGEKGPKGEPKKLTTFRFTSASRVLLEAVAAKHGGTVQEWQGAPDEGYFEVTTLASSLDIVLPPVFSDADGRPTTSYSQWFESWSGGGCQRRCDGLTEMLSSKPCMCNPEARQCKTTTRVSFMLPDIPGLGVWRLDTHGEYAAIELPGTLEMLTLAASEHKFIPAVLRAEQRTKKVPGEGTRRFVVPVIDLPHVTVNQLAAGDVPLALNGPMPVAPKPELPRAVPPPPDDPRFQHSNGDDPGWGPGPAIPSAGAAVAGGDPHGPESQAAQDEASTSDAPAEAPVISEAQRRRLRAIQREHNVPDDEVKRLVREIGGVESSKVLPVARYDNVVACIQTWAPPAAPASFADMVPESARQTSLAAAGAPGAEETP